MIAPPTGNVDSLKPLFARLRLCLPQGRRIIPARVRQASTGRSRRSSTVHRGIAELPGHRVRRRGHTSADDVCLR